MSGKAKSKGNPRRRTFIQLLVLIVIIVIVSSVIQILLHSKGAEFVFVERDENGFSQIWLADVENPENLRQLTFHEDADSLILDTTEDGYLILYSVTFPFPELSYEIWLYDLSKGKNNQIMDCHDFQACQALQLHHSGKWFIMESVQQNPDESWTLSIYIHDLESSEETKIYEQELSDARSLFPVWVGYSNTVIFRNGVGDDFYDFTLYDVEQNQIIDTTYLDTLFIPVFSDDGSQYALGTLVTDNERENIKTISINQQIISLESPEGIDNALFAMANTRDWHPDNETLLIHTWWEQENIIRENWLHELSLYDTLTGTRETLISNRSSSYLNATFNYDASRILYILSDRDTQLNQLMIFNMETLEETSLPLFGTSPHWVNGGR